MAFKLAVVGSRNFADRAVLDRVLDGYREAHPDLIIISGAAKGADTLAADYAGRYALPLVEYAQAGDIRAITAGPLRGRQIVDDAEEMVAFWEESRGTKSSIELARKKGIPVRVVTPLGNEYWY
jgi:hypothetical protein